ncbi:hypothetical protein ANN_08329 [Periplaneta americana]|uniref:Uncharacterized protein n=1 Tax=Periplaneta americana TaxID=6978 RepID=A0ABQ8T2H6_PERAM|nr:hypothetical protein ANN_08329 [Periplaneta americana]
MANDTTYLDFIEPSLPKTITLWMSIVDSNDLPTTDIRLLPEESGEEDSRSNLRDGISNRELRRIVDSESVAQRAGEMKWKWGGHVARLQQERSSSSSNYVGPLRREEGTRQTEKEMGRRTDTGSGGTLELAGSLLEKELPSEGRTGRNGEREKSSGQKKMSDDRRH